MTAGNIGNALAAVSLEDQRVLEGSIAKESALKPLRQAFTAGRSVKLIASLPSPTVPPRKTSATVQSHV